MEDIDKIRETIARVEAKAIIEYIKRNPDTTMDNVVTELKHKEIASRLTTLSVIEKLIQLGIIMDERKGTYSHRLRYNENFNWVNLASTITTDYLEDVKNSIYALSNDAEIRHEVDKWVDKLKIRPQVPMIQNEDIATKITMKAGRVLVGESGSGKTTLAKYSTKSAYNAAKAKQKRSEKYEDRGTKLKPKGKRLR